MCEERIENAAYIQGVKKADWSQETHLLELIYNSSKVDEAAIIAAYQRSRTRRKKSSCDRRAICEHPRLLSF
jgi:hypothetical protein